LRKSDSLTALGRSCSTRLKGKPVYEEPFSKNQKSEMHLYGR
jgi:hypothetical protein